MMSKILKYIFICSLFFSLLSVVQKSEVVVPVSDSLNQMESVVSSDDGDDSEKCIFYKEGMLSPSSFSIDVLQGNEFFGRTNPSLSKYLFWVERSRTMAMLQKNKDEELISRFVSMSKRRTGYFIYALRKIII